MCIGEREKLRCEGGINGSEKYTFDITESCFSSILKGRWIEASNGSLNLSFSPPFCQLSPRCYKVGHITCATARSKSDADVLPLPPPPYLAWGGKEGCPGFILRDS